MFDYETLRVIWWLLLGVLLVGFAVMDGFDLGVAAIYRFIGRDDAERRALLETIEPVWDGNQVWFILGGGAAFAAWPALYAASFSGFYVAMFLVLLTFIVRPVGFNFRNKLTEPRWRGFWDWVLTIAGGAACLLFGVAMGNLFLGVPFEYDSLMRPLYHGGLVGLLRPFALLAGVVSLSMLLTHGAMYAATKSESPLAERAGRLGRWTALLCLLAFSTGGLWLTGIDGMQITGGAAVDASSNPLNKTVALEAGAWLANYGRHPWMLIAPVLAYAGLLWAIWRSWAGRYGQALLGSGAGVAGIVLTAGFSLFPFLLPSSIAPASSLTVWDASSSKTTLGIMLVAVIIFMPLILLYTAWVFRVLRGRVSLADVREHESLY